ncbi:hypothetical protein N431DRAFT_334724, partial [Stipitochalara longipes BDJ]
ATMATTNFFTSVENIQAWFAGKIAPLEIQTYALAPCSKCRPTIDPCSACIRKQDIIDRDLTTWKILKEWELHLFDNPAENPSAPEFQQLHTQKTAKVQNEINRLYKANNQGIDVQEEKIDIWEEENDSYGKEMGGMVTMADLMDQLEYLDRWTDMEDEVMKAKGWI